MCIRNLSIISLMIVTALSTSSLHAQGQTSVPEYQYGMHLDIAKVIRIDEPAPPTCEIVRAMMTFENSQGAIEQVSFLQQAKACMSE